MDNISDSRCPACGCISQKEIIKAKAWMFHRTSVYDYVLCSKCGSLYRLKLTIDNDELYDSESYSTLNYSLEDRIKSRNRIVNYLIRKRDLFWYENENSMVGSFLSKKFYAGFPFRNVLRHGMKFIDIGSGVGETAYILREMGFDTYAIEPYLSCDIKYKNGLIIKKAFISDLEKIGIYDVVFMNSVVEHLENPKETLKICYRLLKWGGVCCIAIPGYGKMTEMYKADSYVIQAPQHVCLYSEKGIKELISDTGFKIELLERNAIFRWYAKSFMIRNNLASSETEFSRKIKKLSIRQYFSIYKQYRKGKKDSASSDYFRIVLRK